MAQFPDVERAVSAVQEILNTPHGPHIRKNNAFWLCLAYIQDTLECIELLDDHSESQSRFGDQNVNMFTSDGCYQ